MIYSLETTFPFNAEKEINLDKFLEERKNKVDIKYIFVRIIYAFVYLRIIIIWKCYLIYDKNNNNFFKKKF